MSRSSRPPNTRMQRTRSSPSALRSPLMRWPLGGPWLILLFAVAPAWARALPQSLTPTPAQGGVANQPVPVLVKRVEPKLPAGSMPGTAILSARITERGEVKDIKVLRSAGRGLDQYYVEALRQFKYKPASRDGKPVEAPLTISFSIRPQ
jgi:TonB family protein